MNPFSFVYNELLFRPLFNLLIGITNFLPTHSIGISIILVTLIVRLVLLPASLHQAKQMHRNQSKMKEVKHELDKIKEKHKNDKTKQAQATMELYRKAGINPAQGCLPLLIQLPILIALYRVFLIGITPETFQYLYTFVSPPGDIQTVFLGINLYQPSLRLGILAGLAQFAQMRIFMPTSSTPQPAGSEQTAQLMASMQKNMAYIFPVMTVFIALQLPAALALYWLITTVFALIQQAILKRTLKLEGSPPPI